MVKFVAINKYGVPEQGTFKTVDNLYKKCKFRKNDDFENRKTWRLLANNNTIYIHIFAKNTGRHMSINKFDLPPPIDNDLFYGTVGVVASTDEANTTHVDLTVDMWTQVYDKLMGGFEDLDNDDNDPDEEEEEIPEEYQTKQGYSKETNFVVDDGEVEYNSSSSSPEEEEYDFSGDDSDCESFHSVGSNDDEGIPEDEFIPSEEDEVDDADSELSEEEIEKEN